MENLIAKSVNKQDGHGGKSEEHLAEMKKIAQEVFREQRERMMVEIKEMILKKTINQFKRR